ncbi:MAG: GxxExxY protein [Opitutales bacterium]|nr:GxxExxY protein [Opitutales bacterium]
MNKTENEIGKIIVNTAFDIHRELGVGLLENVYEAVLYERLKAQGLQVSGKFLLQLNLKNCALKMRFARI